MRVSTIITTLALGVTLVSVASTTSVSARQGGKTGMHEVFITAVTSGDVARVREMLAGDASLARTRDVRGVSALLLALYYQRKDVAALLAEGRTDLDVFEAAATGDASRVRTLIGANPALVNAFSPDGFPPLGLAVFFGQASTAEALVAAGADPSLAARNDMKVAPVHAAAAAGRIDLARLVLEHGADPNARQQQGYVALHEAARAGNIELVRLLVEHGADVNAKTDDGKTALGLAGGSGEVAAYLREHGAQ